MKTKYLLIILLSFLFLIRAKPPEKDVDDSDLVVDDDDDDSHEKESKQKEVPKQEGKTPTSKRKNSMQDDMDEFDDPELLRKKDEKLEMEKEMKKNPNMKFQSEPIKNKQEKPESNPKNFKDWNMEEKIKYIVFKRFDLILAALFLVCVLNAFIGVRVNKSIANLWLAQNQQFFENNYAHLGVEKEYNPKSKNLLVPESYNKYKFFASGRVYENYLLVFITLKKRQDLLTTISSLFLLPEKDHIQYHSSVIPNDDMPVVFLICKNKVIKTLKKQYEEVVEFTEEMNLECLNSRNLALFTENEEIIERLFKNNTILEQYKKIADYIEMIFFSDRKSFSQNDHAIAFSYEFDKINQPNVFEDITKFSHMVIDFICSSSVKSSYKKEAENRRKEYDLRKSKELAEKNAEEVKNKKEEMKNIIKKPLTREQAIKLEEKERQDNLKKQKRKMFKIIKN